MLERPSVVGRGGRASRWATRAARVLLGAALAACSRPEPITVELPRPPVSTARPEIVQAPAPPPSAKPAEPVAPTAFPLDSLQSNAPKLGAACGESQRAFCGQSGRIAVTGYRFEHHRFREDLPCKPLGTTRTSLTVEREIASACVAGDRLYVETTCIVCRISSGTVVEGLVSEMTHGQLEFVQRHAGLRGAPLRTAAAWERAIADAHADHARNANAKPNN